MFIDFLCHIRQDKFPSINNFFFWFHKLSQLFLPFLLFFHHFFNLVFIQNELPKIIWPLWNKLSFCSMLFFFFFFCGGFFLLASVQLLVSWQPQPFFPPKSSASLSSLPLVTCLEPPSYLIWLLVLLQIYPPGASDSWPGEECCSSLWSLNMSLASTSFSGFSVDSSLGLYNETFCVILRGIFGSLWFLRFC